MFSFHPFDGSSLSYNGFANEPRLNQKLVDAGVLVKFRKADHVKPNYGSVPKIDR